jgi:hypothetical protein
MESSKQGGPPAFPGWLRFHVFLAVEFLPYIFKPASLSRSRVKFGGYVWKEESAG